MSEGVRFVDRLRAAKCDVDEKLVLVMELDAGILEFPELISQRECKLCTDLGIRVPRGVRVRPRRREVTTDDELRKLFWMRGRGSSLSEIGMELGCSKGTISQILNGVLHRGRCVELGLLDG